MCYVPCICSPTRTLQLLLYSQKTTFQSLHPVPPPVRTDSTLERFDSRDHRLTYSKHGAKATLNNMDRKGEQSEKNQRDIVVWSPRTYLISDEELVSQVCRVDEGGPVHLGRVDTGLLDWVLCRQVGQ